MNTANGIIIPSRTIPAPPEGWEYRNCVPRKGQEFAVYTEKQNKWIIQGESSGEEFHCTEFAYAFRIAKKTRLMTPIELAGKWLHAKDSHILVTAYQEAHVCAHLTGTKHEGYRYSMRDLVAMGATWSETPTSDQRSLEVEE